MAIPGLHRRCPNAPVLDATAALPPLRVRSVARLSSKTPAGDSDTKFLRQRKQKIGENKKIW
jgi:hypothetical protein